MADNKTISLEEVAHMATLSRLSVSEEEQTLFARQMGDILAYMDVLARVDTNDVEPLYSPAQHPAPCGTMCRPGGVSVAKYSPTRPRPMVNISSCPASSSAVPEQYCSGPALCSSPAITRAGASRTTTHTLRKPQCRTYLRTP